MCEYGFTEGKDFNLLKFEQVQNEGKDYTPYIFVHPQNKQEITDHQITLDMAKEMCMIQRKEKRLRERFCAFCGFRTFSS